MKLKENPDKNSDRQTATWDLSNFFNNYFILFVTQIGSAFFSFASVKVATTYLGIDAYGNIIALLAASAVLQIFVNWTNIALGRFGVEEFVETGKISKSFWGRTIILAVNAFLVIITLPLWLSYIRGWLSISENTAYLIVLHFLVVAISLHIQQTLQAVKLLKIQGIIFFLERFFIFIGLIAFVKLNYSWQIAFWAYIIGSLVTSLIGILFTAKFIFHSFEIDRTWIRKILLFSFPLIPYTITGYLSTNYLDAFFILQYFTKSDLAVYAIAYQISGIVLQFPTLAGSLLLPLFVTLQSQKRDNRIKYYLEDLLPILTLAWSLAAVLFSIGAILVLPYIFGNEMSQINAVIWTFIVGTAFAFPSLVGFSPFMTSVKATYMSFPFAVVTALTNFGGNLILIPRYGLLGSAYATILSYIFGSLVIIIFLQVKFSIIRKWLIPALIPATVSIIYFSWTENILQALVVTLVSTGVLLLIYGTTIVNEIRALWNIRAELKR